MDADNLFPEQFSDFVIWCVFSAVSGSIMEKDLKPPFGIGWDAIVLNVLYAVKRWDG
jgi:hypothetical protein